MDQRKYAASTLALRAVDSFLGHIAESDGADQAVSGLSDHLSGFETAALPPVAHDAWRRIARLLRTPADRPISEQSVLAMRSWPQSRISELIGLMRELHAVLAKIENDRLDDEIRDSIRHHYL
ncbi:MAG: hypothetical protein AB7L90_01625 [Hyphomicrobiaceae bacterium]